MANPVGVTSAAGKAAETTKKKITEFKVKHILFFSDHGVLKDHSSDWLDKGKPYPRPDWTPGKEPNPISHSMDQNLLIHLVVEYGPKDAEPEGGVIYGKSRDEWCSFEENTVAVPTDHRIILIESKKKVPLTVGIAFFFVDWTLKFKDGRTIDGGKSGPHFVYITMGFPRVESHARVLRNKQGKMIGISKGAWAEDGATVKRMETAVQMVARHWSAELARTPSELVWRLMREVPAYRLRPSEKVPPQFKHPNYFNDCGGAWPIIDYLSELAECQAICRMVRGILTQIGCPGHADIVLVYALERIDDGKTALLDVFEMGRALHGHYKIVNGTYWYPALMDGPVEEGKLYPPSHTDLGEGKLSPGFNCFEACLRFTHDNRSYYFGGGAGRYDSKEQVLKAFWGLVWFSSKPMWGGIVFHKIEKIVAQYRDVPPPGAPPPTTGATTVIDMAPPSPPTVVG